MNQLLTINEAAATLRVGHQAVRAAIKKGDLIAALIGGDWRISVEHLNEYLAGRSNKPKRAIYSVRPTLGKAGSIY
ncbi:helix-turn-helix domain-containing protein [Flaviaesturariibacter amylovorans]|uniref:Helix-turn-helix domain-containing protein n=1 Tax=Flaviaesturariibacter amylovorans TaxID=1084520 RepID=A0ABP8GXS1_9BACT